MSAQSSHREADERQGGKPVSPWQAKRKNSFVANRHPSVLIRDRAQVPVRTGVRYKEILA
jgi:hypothetical protein